MSRKLLTQTQLDLLLAAELEYPESPESSYDSPFLNMIMSIDRGDLMKSFIERGCSPGEIIFEENESGDTMYLIWSGRVAIFKGNPNAPTILAYRGTGAIMGEMAVLENQPRSATVVALDNTRLLGMNRQRFEKLLQENPLMSLKIMGMFSSRLRESDEARNTGELSEKRLVRQMSALQNEKEKLEEFERLRQETTDLVIHDLRNPLTTIGVSLKLLTFVLPEDVLEKNQEIITIAQSSCKRMQRLVDSLLDVSKMEAGETQFSMSTFDLGSLIEESVRRFSLINTKGVLSKTNIPKDLPMVYADREKIERVITNLIDNAYKYTPDNGYIHINVKRKAESVQVCVIDSGTGIPKKERERVFERFTQVSSERGKQRGFGLGLAYCKLAIERHDGRIWAEAGEDNIGSCFCFTLPVATQS